MPAALALALLLAACTSQSAPAAARSEPTGPATLDAAEAAEGATATPACGDGVAATRTLQVESAVYGGTDRVLVHGVECPSGAVSVLYLLHGAGADASQWPDVDAFAAVDALQAGGRGTDVLIVVPDATAAYGCGSDCGAGLAHHLLDEVEPLVVGDGTRVARRAIGGISRGGGLAFDVVSSEPGRFAALGGHSPAGVGALDVTTPGLLEIPIWIDVGESDGLASAAAEATRDLRTEGASVTYRPAPGGHDRSYWRARAPEYLDWYVTELEGGGA